MENKNYSPIRNRMSLIETIKKSLNEDLISKAALDGKLVATELEGYLKAMIKDAAIADELTKLGVRTSEELLTALKGNRLTSTLKGALELSVLKSNTKNAKMIDLAAENLVRNGKFNQKYAAEFAKGQPAYEKALKQAGYSEDAITAIVQKKFNLPKPKPVPPNPNPKPTPPPPVKTWWEKWKDKFEPFLKNKPSWKQVVAWGAGLGIGAAALWWMIDTFASDKKGDDFPPVPPVDDTAWAPCIKELVKSKEASIVTTPKGATVVVIKNEEYPKGIQFYTNGRVMDLSDRKMGHWKCKNGTPTIQAESKIMSLTRLVLNEQGSEVSDETMDSYVDTAVDDLDGYVAEYNLKSLKDILTALRGKTYQGEDAIKKFLDFYKQDEGVDFVSDVESVGVKNLSVMAKNMKPQIIAMAKGGGGVVPTPKPGGGKGLSNIDIKWDGGKKDDSKKDDKIIVPKPNKGVNYHDCSSKDFPYEFGCIAPKIAEMQGCLNITPQKGYFGPKTKTILEGLGHDLSKGITIKIYEDVKAKCNKITDEPTRKKYSDAELAPIARPKISDIKPIDTGKLGDLSGKIKPIDTGSSSTNGESLYKTLQSNYQRGEKPFIFSDGEDGGRIKYKGASLGEEALSKLSQYIETLGYRENPIKDKDKRYGVKYVWKPE
jgi:hypothetical protein